MQYIYKGRDGSGNAVEGSLEARSLDAALDDLKRQKITPITVNEGKASSSSLADFDVGHYIKEALKSKHVAEDDLILFCRQMFALTRSGIPLIRAISGLADATRNEYFSEVLKEVVRILQQGTDLATSMARFPKVFSVLFVAMIRMGETTGQLDAAFKQLIDHLELEKETQKRIKSATRYPTFVIIAIAVALGVVNYMVIPSFDKVFKQLGADLPITTKILIATSEFTVNYWWIILTIIFVTGFSWYQYVRTPDGELFWDRLKLRLPLVGHIFERITLGRFTRPFAMMLDSGVPLLQALSVSSRTVGNAYIGQAIEGMQKGIERGEALLSTAANANIFTPLVLQMIAVGEETGNIGAMLNDVSDFYEQEVDYDLKQLAEAIEPILLVFMGGIVLILALGVFLPMWELSAATQ